MIYIYNDIMWPIPICLLNFIAFGLVFLFSGEKRLIRKIILFLTFTLFMAVSMAAANQNFRAIQLHSTAIYLLSKHSDLCIFLKLSLHNICRRATKCENTFFIEWWECGTVYQAMVLKIIKTYILNWYPWTFSFRFHLFFSLQSRCTLAL